MLREVFISEILKLKKNLHMDHVDEKVIVESCFTRVTNIGTRLWDVKIALTRQHLITLTPFSDCLSCKLLRPQSPSVCLCLRVIPYPKVSMESYWPQELLVLVHYRNLYSHGRKIGHRFLFQHVAASCFDSSWSAWQQAVIALYSGQDEGRLFDVSDHGYIENATVLHGVSCVGTVRDETLWYWPVPVIKDSYKTPAAPEEKDLPESNILQERPTETLPKRKPGLFADCQRRRDYPRDPKLYSRDKLLLNIRLPKGSGLCFNEEFGKGKQKVEANYKRWMEELLRRTKMSEEEVNCYKVPTATCLRKDVLDPQPFQDVLKKSEEILDHILRYSNWSPISFPECELYPHPDHQLSSHYGSRPRYSTRFQTLRRCQSEYQIQNCGRIGNDVIDDELMTSRSRFLDRNVSLDDLNKERLDRDTDFEFLLLGDMGIGCCSLPEDLAAKKLGYLQKLALIRISMLRNSCCRKYIEKSRGIRHRNDTKEDLETLLQNARFEQTDYSHNPHLISELISHGRNFKEHNLVNTDIKKILPRKDKPTQLHASHPSEELKIDVEVDLPHCKITELTPRALALEVSRIEKQLFLALRPQEIVRWICKPHTVDSANCPNLIRTFQFSSRLCHVVTTEIINRVYAEDNCNMLAFFVEVIVRCYSMQNFQSVRSILFGLLSPSVVRLEEIWNEFHRTYPDHYWSLNRITYRVKSVTLPQNKNRPCILAMDDVVLLLRQSYGFLIHNLPPPIEGETGICSKLYHVAFSKDAGYKQRLQRLGSIIKNVSVSLKVKFKSRFKDGDPRRTTSLAANEKPTVATRQLIRTDIKILTEGTSNFLRSLQLMAKDYSLSENAKARLYLLRMLYRLPNENMKISKKIIAK